MTGVEYWIRWAKAKASIEKTQARKQARLIAEELKKIEKEKKK